jgi:hypothetical protein
MEINLKFYLVTVMLFILGGCSSQYVVTFDSNPKGASLVCNGKNLGHTPRKLYYDESVKQRSTINVGDCSANWISGVRKRYPSNLKVFPQSGTIISLDRPSGDGYAQDAGYALQLRQTQAAESAASAARDSATAAQRQNNKTTTCYTNYGVTTCY